ncbi:myosin-2 heavy chain, non muscle [Eurytemora carolleeae]|uniref:myosin-2 heavy chain, non muscle n=1 Tax=Eurytemora carolleeae TaxID=1294199 RepID=UPI000C7846AF|nr:myosin-2 heavy chain, non muscle [Eurytemora carolleeae]|eukprot:XP_023339094.1 myosin-2 heavy chain, non muscle-like [Eurytemora affinis]
MESIKMKMAESSKTKMADSSKTKMSESTKTKMMEKSKTECWCDHSQMRLKEKEMLKDLNKQHIELIMDKNSQIKKLVDQLNQRKSEISIIKEEIQRSVSSRKETMKNIEEQMIERFSEQEDKYREKIRDLEASNLDLKSEARRIHALEDQVRRLEEDLEKVARERNQLQDLLYSAQEENSKLNQKCLVQENLNMERETTREEILTRVVEECGHVTGSYDTPDWAEADLQELYSVVIQQLNTQDVSTTPFCNETLRTLLEELIKEGDVSRRRREEEYREELKESQAETASMRAALDKIILVEELKESQAETASMRAALDEMRRRLEEAQRSNLEMEQRIQDERAVTERVERERRELLENIQSCKHNEVDLSDDIEVYRKTLEYQGKINWKHGGRSRHSSGGSSSSSSSSSSGANGDDKTTKLIRINPASLPSRPPISSRPPSSQGRRVSVGLTGMGTSGSIASNSGPAGQLSGRRSFSTRTMERNETKVQSFQSSTAKSGLSNL